MQDLFESGRVADAVIALMLIEFFVLARLRRGAGRLAANFAAGLCLLLALRFAQGGAAWPWLALSLAGAGVAHVLDLRSR